MVTCRHGKNKRTCYACSPHNFCKHGKYGKKLINQCAVCTPHKFCDHGRRKTKRMMIKCPICNPLIICPHSLIKYDCPQCPRRHYKKPIMVDWQVACLGPADDYPIDEIFPTINEFLIEMTHLPEKTCQTFVI